MEVALRRYIYIVSDALLHLILNMIDLIANTYYWFYQNQYINVEGRSVLITGCDSGFGHSSAGHFASKGVRVFAGCLTNAGVDSLNGKENITPFIMDVTSDESVEGAQRFVEDQCKKYRTDLWAVIANAGVAPDMVPVQWSRVSEYHKAIDVNQLGVVRTVLAFLPMVEKCKGRIVIMSSMAGYSIGQYWGPYHMSKAAVAAFAEALTYELALKDVRVVNVAPSFYPTQLPNVWKTMKYRYEKLPQHMKGHWPDAEVNKMIAGRQSYIAAMSKLNKVSEIPEIYYHAAFGAVPRYTYFLGRRYPRLLMFSRFPDFMKAYAINKTESILQFIN